MLLHQRIPLTDITDELIADALFKRLDDVLRDLSADTPSLTYPITLEVDDVIVEWFWNFDFSTGRAHHTLYRRVRGIVSLTTPGGRHACGKPTVHKLGMFSALLQCMTVWSDGTSFVGDVGMLSYEHDNWPRGEEEWERRVTIADRFRAFFRITLAERKETDDWRTFRQQEWNAKSEANK